MLYVSFLFFSTLDELTKSGFVETLGYNSIFFHRYSHCDGTIISIKVKTAVFVCFLHCQPCLYIALY